MALSDFWELKDHQVLGGKNVLNVYHVKRILAGANAQTVVDAYVQSILQLHLQALQVLALSRTTIDCANLGDVTDFVSFDSSGRPGNRAGEQYANFVSASIQFNRTRTDMKNGQKRYLVGNEADALDGVWDLTFRGLLANMAVALIDPWETAAAPGVDVGELVILKRFCVVPAQDPCQQYRLPDTDAEVDANHYNPNVAVVRVNQRSQVSRKIL